MITNLAQRYRKKSPKDEGYAKEIIAYILKFPRLAQYRDDIFDVKELHFADEKLAHLKELLTDDPAIPSEANNLMKHEQTRSFASLGMTADGNLDLEIKEIENIVARLADIDLESATIKFRLLLLKDLLLQVEAQYKEFLYKNDELETHATAVSSQKIKEIFNYKKSLEAMILALEKELI